MYISSCSYQYPIVTLTNTFFFFNAMFMLPKDLFVIIS